MFKMGNMMDFSNGKPAQREMRVLFLTDWVQNQIPKTRYKATQICGLIQ